MSLRLVPGFALACALAAAVASAQTPAVPVFDISVRVHTEDPALEIEGQVVVPAGSSPIASVELQIDRRIADLEIAARSRSVSERREHTRIDLGFLIIDPPQFHTCLCGDEQRDSLIVLFPQRGILVSPFGPRTALSVCTC